MLKYKCIGNLYKSIFYNYKLKEIDNHQQLIYKFVQDLEAI